MFYNRSAKLKIKKHGLNGNLFNTTDILGGWDDSYIKNVDHPGK